MATLLVWRLDYAKVAPRYPSQGRCDARCYDSPAPARSCTCVCGGKNHGIGLQAALARTQEHFEEWREEAERHGVILGLGRGARRCQLPLFPGPMPRKRRRRKEVNQ
ncbi:MAG: hypothetical protein C4542_09780 [Dehalococcoidia bacterium]|nr:MAG: hypothetical protein C4542_09780 [Dehalococcoidia bacterium]